MSAEDTEAPRAGGKTKQKHEAKRAELEQLRARIHLLETRYIPNDPELEDVAEDLRRKAEKVSQKIERLELKIS